MPLRRDDVIKTEPAPAETRTDASYREAVGADLPEIVRLWVLLKNEEVQYYPGVDINPLRGVQEIAQALRSGSTFMGVLEAAPGRLVGFIHCDTFALQGGGSRTGVVVSCYVEPEYRHLHKSIWGKVERWAKQFGILRLQFQTLKGNRLMERFASSRAVPLSTVYEMNLLTHEEK